METQQEITDGLNSALNEAALARALRAIINVEISNRIDQIVEAQKNENDFDIEDYRGDIETMISEYINYNVTVTIEG